MTTAQRAASHSTFRTVALAVSGIATILYLHCVAAVAWHGGYAQDFGWTFDRPHGRLVVGTVRQQGPADGILLPGDELLAWNGDRALENAGTVPFGRNLRGDADYALTVRRAGVEHTVTLDAPRRAVGGQQLQAIELLIAFVWLTVATMIAIYRPELAVSRVAFAAGILMACLHAHVAAGDTLPWLPHWWRTAVLLVFPWFPLHVAVGYDFYSRFPPGVAPTGLWNAVRIGLYALCILLFAFGDLVTTIVDVIAPERAGSVASLLRPLDRWLLWPSNLLMPVAGVAILAVVRRNYEAVQREDDRRRLRWVVWGTVLGMAPFLIVQTVASLMGIAGRPFDEMRWNPVVSLGIVLIPISLGYAIIRHHIFDITFVVRRGVRYLLARNALRLLLALPIAGLAYGVLVHRDESIAELFWARSAYLYLIALALLGMTFRAQLSHWIDRRFFREAFDRQRMLVGLIDAVEKLETVPGVSKLVGHELEAAFHPKCLFIWYRDDNANLTLSFSSGGAIHSVELARTSPLVQLVTRTGGIVEWPVADRDSLPRAEQDWLDDAGVRLMVPMIGTDRDVAGLLMLGDKKSEEPYSSDDERLLLAIARQIAMARAHGRLQVTADSRVRDAAVTRLAAIGPNGMKECPTCGLCYDADDENCAADGSKLTVSLLVQRTFDGKYRLERRIGKGGMGVVYEATDLRLARRVAVKIMLGRGFADRRAQRRFEREAQVCAQLTHPNIVTVFDFGSAGTDGAFLVMEFVEGSTLRHELSRRGAVPGPLAATWFEQICEGVAAAHARHVVHRDLKPENIIIATTVPRAASVKVLDFGLAKVRTLDDGGLTDPGVVMGTLGYMAPEQLKGSDVDQRVDVFAIGVMATEAILGHRPFRGRTHSELLTAIASHRIALGASTQHRELELVLRRATALDPIDRYATVAEMTIEMVPSLRALPSEQDSITRTTLPTESL